MVYLCKPFFVLLEMVGTGVAEFVLHQVLAISPIKPLRLTTNTHKKYWV